MKLSRLLLLGLSCMGLAHADVTLTPTKDSDVYSYFDGPSYSIFDLNIGASGEGMPHSHHALIQFDLSGVGLPASRVKRAVLRLYSMVPGSSNGGGLRPGILSVYRQGQAWQVSGLKWSHLQGAELAAEKLIDVTNQWVDIEVTGLVKQWVSGSAPNHGFLLRPQSETLEPLMNVMFASMELASAGYAPQLVIEEGEETPPVPPVLGVALEAGDEVVVRWASDTAGAWTLQRSNGDFGVWENVTTGVNWLAGQSEYRGAKSSTGREFFRLYRP